MELRARPHHRALAVSRLGRITSAVVTAPGVEPLLNLNDSELEWKRFERFCLDLVKSLPEVRDAHLYGTRGEDQQGIDIHVDLVDERGADDDLVFAHPQSSRPLDRTKLTRRFRHTFATRSAAFGQPMRTIQEFFGHADSKTTQI